MNSFINTKLIKIFNKTNKINEIMLIFGNYLLTVTNPMDTGQKNIVLKKH